MEFLMQGLGYMSQVMILICFPTGLTYLISWPLTFMMKDKRTLRGVRCGIFGILLFAQFTPIVFSVHYIVARIVALFGLERLLDLGLRPVVSRERFLLTKCILLGVIAVLFLTGLDYISKILSERVRQAGIRPFDM